MKTYLEYTCELSDGCSHQDTGHFLKLQLEAGRKDTSLSLFGSRKFINFVTVLIDKEI